MHLIQEVTNVWDCGTGVVESSFGGSEQFPLATLVADNGIDVHHPFVELVLWKKDEDMMSIDDPAEYDLNFGRCTLGE